MSVKVLEKTVNLGDMRFKVGVDRDIALQVFEEFPDLIEYFIKSEKIGTTSDAEFFIKSLRDKSLSTFFKHNNELSKLIAYALPLMLKKAGDHSNADNILEYAEDNNATSTLNSAMLKFLFEGFTLRELAKPTIKFSMK